MYDLIIYRNAHLARKLTIPQKRALGTVILHSCRHEIINGLGRHTGLDEPGNLVQHGSSHGAGGSHQLQIAITFQDDHLLEFLFDTPKLKNFGEATSEPKDFVPFWG